MVVNGLVVGEMVKTLGAPVVITMAITAVSIAAKTIVSVAALVSGTAIMIIALVVIIGAAMAA